MSRVTIPEVVEALALANELIHKLCGLPYLRGERTLERIRSHGIAPPDDMALVPTEPTPEQIEEGAQGIASWEEGCVWPTSWSNSQVLRMRKDARSAYVAMIAAAPKQENE